MNSFDKLYFLRPEVIVVGFLIAMMGFFGIVLMSKTNHDTVNLSITNSDAQAKIVDVNKNLFRFILYDEKSFPEVVSGGIGVDSVAYNLNFYKEQFLLECDDSLIDKKKVDSLVNVKLGLIRRYECVSKSHIKVASLYVKDTAFKALRFIGKSKVTYRVDPKKLKTDITSFDHNRNDEINSMILDNLEINYLISREVSKYVDNISRKMASERLELVSRIDRGLDYFIVSTVVVLLLIIFLVKVLVYDLDKVVNIIDKIRDILRIK